jgi:hypothetical protein
MHPFLEAQTRFAPIARVDSTQTASGRLETTITYPPQSIVNASSRKSPAECPSGRHLPERHDNRIRSHRMDISDAKQMRHAMVRSPGHTHKPDMRSSCAIWAYSFAVLAPNSCPCWAKCRPRFPAHGGPAPPAIAGTPGILPSPLSALVASMSVAVRTRWPARSPDRCAPALPAPRPSAAASRGRRPPASRSLAVLPQG